MLGIVGFPRTDARVRLGVLGLVVAAILLLGAGGATQAHASGCENSWAKAESGSWFTAANWSTKKVPVAGEEVCITEPGTYTVEMNQTVAVSVKALTLGATSGTQTLAVASTNAAHAVLTTSAGITNGAHGSITLTNSETNGNNVTIVGPVSNAGTITSELAKGGTRSLQGNLVNTGTIAINTTTQFNGTSAALTNEGAINLATGTSLVFTGKATITNGSGGSVAGAGTGNVAIEPESTFTEGAGTTSGSKPVVVRDAGLKYTGSGASLIAIHGQSSTISGNVSSGQSIVIESNNSEHAYLTAAASYSNAGTITLTSIETSPNQAALITTSGTLTNSGSINVEVGVGGLRFLEGDVTNTGTIAINATTRYDAASALLTNEGAIKLATGTLLVVTNKGAVTNGTGGSIVAAGTGAVAIEPECTFTEGAGTTSGSKPVVVRDAGLKYTGAGASLIAIHGTTSTISGNVSSGQSIVIESNNSENAYLTAAVGFASAGTITLTSIETSPNQAAMIITSGTLTTSGSIKSEVGVGGLRFLEGSVTNTGTIAVNATTRFDTPKATLTNQGTISVASGVSLLANAEPTVSNEAGGMIAATGSGALVQTQGTFNQGLGKTTTSKTSEAVILDRVALHYTDKGVSKIAQRGASTLSGTINKKVTLSIQSSCSAHAVDTAAGSFANSGTINLTNAETCPNNATLNLAGGTLENKGTVNVLFPHGGTRSIEGSLTNEKTLSIGNDASQALKVTGSYAQSGAKAALKLTIAGSTNFSRLNVSGAVTLAGKLALKQLKFTGKAAESFAIIGGASSRTGEFASVTGNAIKGGGLHYIPHYTATGVNLVVE